MKVPNSPFSTRLSGGAKEIELRLRSIFQWKKKRLPVIVLLAAVLLIVLCGSIVCFVTPTEEKGPKIVMMTQYYDDLGRIVEIPKLELPADWEQDTAAVEAINQVIGDLALEHAETVEEPLNTIGTTCRFYPTETDRYLNLVFYQDYWGSSGNDGAIVTLVYDKAENRVVEIEEALELAGMTEEQLKSELIDHYNTQMQMQESAILREAQKAAISGFRIKTNGEVEFYMTAVCDDPLGEQDMLDGWQHLFVRSENGFVQYYCHAQPPEETPLIPPEETMMLEYPLWCQWYFGGGEPHELVKVSGQAEEQEENSIPTLTVSVEELFNTVMKAEESQTYPAQTYRIELTGLSVPMTLTMQRDMVMAAEAYGQRMTLTEPLDVYGNCDFDLFEADDAVILEGGYYGIGDIYVLSSEGCSEVHPGEEVSYYLYRDDRGDLKYRLSHNEMPTITQAGALWVVTQYGELLRAYGDASIENGKLLIAQRERQEFIDYERLQKEFENGWWREKYHSVEEILENNRAQKEGREPSPIYGVEYRDQLVRDYYAKTYQRNFYLAGDQPAQPQEGDCRIEQINVLAETRVYEVTGQLLEVLQSRWYDNSGWSEFSGYLVITKGIDNAYEQVIGTAYIRNGQTAEEVILEKVHGLSDLEVSLWREGYPWPVGPGSQIHIYREAYDGPETVEVLDGWEPIYYEGDYWAMHRWSGVEALCYHRAADGGYGVNTFDTTRTDLRTYRGICVGDSREKVLEVYPELKSGDYWGKYPGEDYLWYCTSEQDFGAALIFFFENDAVSHIVLTDMFN